MTTAFERVDVFDGTEILRDQTVLVDGPVITALGRGMKRGVRVKRRTDAVQGSGQLGRLRA